MNISDRLNFQITITGYGKTQSMKSLLTEENIVVKIVSKCNTQTAYLPRLFALLA